MRSVCILIAFLIKTTGYAQEQKENALVASLQGIEFSAYKKVSELDKRFVKFFERKTKESLKMANPTDTFNVTDVRSTSLPNKRLIFLGKSGKNAGVITYQQGGNAQQYFCIIYQKSPKAYTFCLIRLHEGIGNIKNLKEAVATRQYEMFNCYPK